MMGLLDLEKVISLTGFKSHVLHNLDDHPQGKKKGNVIMSSQSKGQEVKQFGGHAHLTTPFSRPPAITLTDTPSGWLEKATEQMISRQCTWPIRSPLTVHSRRSLPPPTTTQRDNRQSHRGAKLSSKNEDHIGEESDVSPESQTVAMSPVVSLADTAVTGLLWPVRLCT